MKTSIRRTLETAISATLAAGFLAAGAAAASAHVTVDPSSTSEGGFTKLTFSVPNESDTTVILPAAQGYTDGTTVNWADTESVAHDHAAASSAAASAATAESRPAPFFVTTAAQDGASAHATEASSAVPAAPSTSDGGDRTVGWFGLAAGLIGLAAGVTALARSRSSAVMSRKTSP